MGRGGGKSSWFVYQSGAGWAFSEKSRRIFIGNVFGDEKRRGLEYNRRFRCYSTWLPW
jgi:hypothetical protein